MYKQGKQIVSHACSKVFIWSDIMKFLDQASATQFHPRGSHREMRLSAIINDSIMQFLSGFDDDEAATLRLIHRTTTADNRSAVCDSLWHLTDLAACNIRNNLSLTTSQGRGLPDCGHTQN